MKATQLAHDEYSNMMNSVRQMYLHFLESELLPVAVFPVETVTNFTTHGLVFDFLPVLYWLALYSSIPTSLGWLLPHPASKAFTLCPPSSTAFQRHR